MQNGVGYEGREHTDEEGIARSTEDIKSSDSRIDFLGSDDSGVSETKAKNVDCLILYMVGRKASNIIIMRKKIQNQRVLFLPNKCFILFEKSFFPHMKTSPFSVTAAEWVSLVLIRLILSPWKSVTRY